MIRYLVMIMVNVLEAKTRLSELLEQVASGERVVICKRNQPVAEIHPVAAARTTPRTLGLASGRFTVPEVFFEPLPADVLSEFEGRGSALASRVAEPPPPAYGSSKRRRPVRGRR